MTFANLHFIFSILKLMSPWWFKPENFSDISSINRRENPTIIIDHTKSSKDRFYYQQTLIWHTRVNYSMFQFHRLEHLWAPGDLQNYQIELMPHLLQLSNELQYLE